MFQDRLLLGTPRRQQRQHNRHHQVDYSLMDWAEVNREFSDTFQDRLLPRETFPRPITEHERIEQER